MKLSTTERKDDGNETVEKFFFSFFQFTAAVAAVDKVIVIVNGGKWQKCEQKLRKNGKDTGRRGKRGRKKGEENYGINAFI